MDESKPTCECGCETAPLSDEDANHYRDMYPGYPLYRIVYSTLLRVSPPLTSVPMPWPHLLRRVAAQIGDTSVYPERVERVL